MTSLAASANNLISSVTDRFDATAMARMARRVPEPVIDAAVSSPIRPLIVGTIFKRMPAELKPQSNVDAVVQFKIGEKDGPTENWFVVIKEGRCRTTRNGEGLRPRTTLTMTPQNLIRVATGQIAPMKMFQQADVSISGDLWFASQFSAMFRIPAA